MNDTTPILNDLMDHFRNDVVNSMQSKGRYATGETIQNLTIATADGYGVLYAPWWIDALEVGRKPTSDGAAASDPTLLERIKVWIAAKGLVMNPYAVTKSIHKKGYPGKPGVLTEPLSNDNVNKRVNEAIEKITQPIQQEILDLFNIFDEI
jgi:hypothetical protein